MPTEKKSLEFYLDTVPAREVESERRDDGNVVLLRSRKLGGVFGKLLGPRLPSRTERIRLDDVGSQVWDLIDGERTVAQIAREVEDRLGEVLAQRDHRVSLFVSTMHRNGMISLTGPARGRGGSDGAS